MIGQKKILKSLKSTTFPALSILVGEEGSGKKTILKKVLSESNMVFAESNKKEAVKELIDMAYRTNTLIYYIIPDIDSMSNAAINSLLKVTEEPPNNARFILTCINLDNVLPTLISRAFVYYMDKYSKAEILEYYGEENNKEFVSNVCSTPGEVNKLRANDIEGFKEYVQLVYDHINKVSLANALKIGNKIAFKDEQEGYDLKLFFRAFMVLCVNSYINNADVRYLMWQKITNECIKDLSIKGINKSALFDTWVLKIREVL